jgi:glycosyltransferase involved in cell wall biosynthesis
MSPLIKVCHLSSAHSYLDIRIFVKECCSLAEAGYEIHFIAPDAPNVQKDGVYLHGVPRSAKGRLSRMSQTVWHVYQKAKEVNADVYHFHDPELMTIALFLKQQGKKVVYDVHEDLPRSILSKAYISSVLRKSISVAIEIVENIFAKQWDGIITATPTINRRFEKLGAMAININNYPILSEFNAVAHNWDCKEKVVCYIGSIGKTRGIFDMVDAIGQTEHKLLLAGTFSSNNELEEAQQMETWNKVEYLGFLNRKEIKSIISRSVLGLAVLHPTVSYIKSLPIKMFEYMAAGIPVVVSHFQLWKEIVEGNDCGLCVDPLKPKEIADAIRWIVEHPEEAEQMGKNGRKAVEEKFNWENENRKLLELYEQVLSNK